MRIDGGLRDIVRVLWLTLNDPNPRHSGQLIYSGGLIDSVAERDVEIEVLCLARPGVHHRGNHCDGKISWWIAEDRPRSRLSSLVSRLPHVAKRTVTRSMRRMLQDLLDRQRWDSVVIDGLSLGWTIDIVRRHFSNDRSRPRLIYVSHNHEASVRAQVAGNQTNPFLRRILSFDALKACRLEQKLVAAVDLVTAITGEDRNRYLRDWPQKHVEVLLPGYEGRRMRWREITPDLPRRAIVVGSFDWVAKRMNLEEFIAVADPLFAAAGAELHVIGSAEPAFLDRLRRRVKATVFTGAVESIAEHMDTARLAVVPERSGGGFKLKALDYVFNGLPILALQDSIAGMPLQHPDSVRLFPDHRSLAHGVLEIIDDLPLLNRMQHAAYAACVDRFEWCTRGDQLRSVMVAP
jgi:glycosyltransferase involved in cell wall biosynthesis